MAAPVFDPAYDQVIPGRALLDRAPASALRRPTADGPIWDEAGWAALTDQVPGVDDEEWRSEPGWAEVERLESPEVIAELLFQIWIAPGLLTLPRDRDDAWIGVDRVPPRPLLGVTGCAGPGLATGLREVDPRRLTPGQLVEVLTGAERLIRWAQGLQLSAAAGLAEYATIVDPDHQNDPLFGGERAVEVGFSSPREIGEFCADGIGAALGTNHMAGRQLIQAGCMTAELPVIQELLAVGLLDLPRVKALLRELCRVPDLAADLDWVNQAIREHHLLTPRLLGNTVRKLVMERYPEQAETGRKAAKQRRRVSVEPCEDGMAMFKAFLSAEDALMAYRALTEAAWLDHDHRRHTDEQPACDEGEVRREALVDWVEVGDLHRGSVVAGLRS